MQRAYRDQTSGILYASRFFLVVTSLLSYRMICAAAAAHHHPLFHRRFWQAMTTTTNPLFRATFSIRGGGDSTTDTTSTTNLEEIMIDEKQLQQPSPYYQHNRVYLAVGSNMGNRYDNIRQALDLLCSSSARSEEEDSDREEETTSQQQQHSHQQQQVRLVRTSFLHETAPMYVTDQAAFLNGAVELATSLTPHALLKRIKDVEMKLGRQLEGALRNGPRPVDLDILLFDSLTTTTTTTMSPTGGSSNIPSERMVWEPQTLDNTNLTVPHPRMQEREFVLRPLMEVAGESCCHPTLNTTLKDLLQALPPQGAVRVMPMTRRGDVMLCFNQTIIMGILNVTPDSFSDGGSAWSSSIDSAAQRALEMQAEGATIVDIGGESTRPGASEVSVEEELQRTIPVITRIRQESDVFISIDTRRAIVARRAVEAGADIVNDVSGGTHDPKMLETVAELDVPIILMHMRGSPQTMQNMTVYNDVVQDVAAKLLERSVAAEHAGIHRWLQVVDPGIGFAKDLEGNLLLLKHLSQLRSIVGSLPILLGTSRKGFIGKLTGLASPADRDVGTVASCVAALCLDSRDDTCNILRVHNVAAARQACLVMDAIKQAS